MSGDARDSTLPGDQDLDAGVRMSFGDHLEELRNCLIRALVGVGLGGALTLLFGQNILEIIIRPLLIVQYRNGLEPSIQVLSPTGAFVAYLKISLLAGLILSMPWVLYQIWCFIQSGLYRHEKRFVKLLMPASIGLFAAGVLFLYFAVLPLILHFLVRFNLSFDTPLAIRAPVAQAPAEEIPSAEAIPRVPRLQEDPAEPEPGELWYNVRTRRLMLHTEEGTLASEMNVQASSGIQSQFALDYYVSFVLMLALAFGLAFQTPIVVFFLAWTGLVKREVMGRYRRHVVLVTLFICAVLTPPDVVSQVLMAIPVYLLFEVGMLAAAMVERRAAASAGSA